MLYNGHSVYADVQEEPTAGGIQTRKKKKTKHGYTTRSNMDDDDAATNRLTRRALYDTDEEVKTFTSVIMFFVNLQKISCNLDLVQSLSRRNTQLFNKRTSSGLSANSMS